MGAESRATFYAFWLSSCSWRVRAALHLKRIPYEEMSVDIVREKKHLTDNFRTINPAQKVPALHIDGVTIVESMAILHYLEETRPKPSLKPSGSPLLRARMVEICETVTSGIQPLQNVGLKSHFESETNYQQFTKYWTDRGLQTLEDMLQHTAGRFCIGDEITMADLCLVPQLYNAVTRHELDLGKYPILSKLYETLLKENVFEETHPRNVKGRMTLSQ